MFFRAIKSRLKFILEKDVILSQLVVRVFQIFDYFLIRKIPALLPSEPEFYAFKHFKTDSPQKLFLDIGANIGLAAFSFRKFDKTSPICCIEPNPALCTDLSKIRKRDQNFEFKTVALGNQCGKLQLFVPFVGRMAVYTSASTSKEYVKQTCEKTIAKKYQPKLSIKSFDVDIVKLDDLSLKPHIIKIDAEGNEKPILEGAEETIKKNKPYLLIEKDAWNFESNTELLSQWGYTRLFYDVKHDRFQKDEILGSRNICFIPNEKLSNLPLGPVRPLNR